MKTTLLKRVIGVSLISLLAIGVLLFENPAYAKNDVRYTKYNIHTQFKGGNLYIASYANYTNPGSGHMIVPAGTEITILDTSRKRIEFRVNSDGKEVRFEFHEPRMGMTVDQYIEKITSATPVSFGKLSALDRKGVEEGKAQVGMTREGVMTALGYPAAHRTPSLDSTTWIYWTNRFGTVAVDFDDHDKVKAVRN